MRKKFILAANWKMNGMKKDLMPFFSELEKYCESSAEYELVFALPYLLLEPAKALTVGRSWVHLAGQNAHFMEKGAFTGEVSLAMLKDIALEWVIIGHSERRQYFAEDDAQVAKKLAAACKAQIKAIVCVGETLNQRKDGLTEDVLQTQLSSIIELGQSPEEFVIAYEPVWAIGTDLSATPEQAEEVHRFIRALFSEKMGKDAYKLRILYGGSMNEKNCRLLLEKPNIDGGLVGGASLDAIKFGQMIKTLKEVKNCY